MNHDRKHYELLILDYFRAVDDARIDDAVACFCEDGSIAFPFLDEAVVGHAALRAFFAAHVARFDTHVDRVTRILIDGDTGISELVFDATAAGRRLRLENCNVYRFREGLFAEVRVYLDTVTMARQLQA